MGWIKIMEKWLRPFLNSCAFVKFVDSIAFLILLILKILSILVWLWRRVLIAVPVAARGLAGFLGVSSALAAVTAAARGFAAVLRVLVFAPFFLALASENVQANSCPSSKLPSGLVFSVVRHLG